MSDSTWFRAQEFEEVDFDPNAYISRHSGVVPLNAILQRLQRHVDTIRADLIDVINADYPLFIGMAEKLGGVAGAAMQIQTPLLKLKEALEELQGRYHSELSSLKECLHQQSQVCPIMPDVCDWILTCNAVWLLTLPACACDLHACTAQVHHTKTMLELVQDAAAVMGKVESLTADLPTSSAPNSLHQAATMAAQIDRIAGEVSRLAFYMTNGKSVPVIQNLGPRLTVVTSCLSNAISATLHSTLQTASAEADAASSSCIHACSLVNRVELAYSALQSVLVAPALDRAALAAAADAAAEAPSSPNRRTSGPPVSLPTFLMHAQSELDPQISRIKNMVARHPDLTSTFDVLGVCTLGQLHAAVQAHVPGAFSPADPDAFHRNYSAAVSFLSWLEEHAATEGALQLLQTSNEFMAFRKAWNLAVYFSLRFQEIAGAFDEQLRTAPVVAAEGSSCTYQQSSALLYALRRCRDSAVAFAAVYDRFLKLQMQLILRFGAWLKEAQPVQTHAGSCAAGTQMCQWAQDASTEDLVALLADVYRVASVLNTDEATAIQAQMQSSTSQAVLDKVKQGVTAAITQMLQGKHGVEDIIVKRMLVASASWKRRVLSIAATYRMTARPPPSKPSHYVPLLLEGPHALQNSPYWSQLPEDAQQELLVKLIEAIISVLKAAAKELLETMAKTQASLSKLGRVRNSPVAGQHGGLSDIEKTQEQLRLDVVEFGRHIELLLGRPAVEMETFEELLKAAAGHASQCTGPSSPTPPCASLPADSAATESVASQIPSTDRLPDAILSSGHSHAGGASAQPSSSRMHSARSVGTGAGTPAA
eukprot:jgi/Ulvmu1/2729/UM014_0186.1